MQTAEAAPPIRTAPRDASADDATLVADLGFRVPSTRSSEDYERAILMAVDYIKSNFRRHLTVSEMAHAAMYSRCHFTRIFRELTAMSPCQFLTAIRIAEAKRLLSETDRTVADICTSVGYQSLGTFTGRFTELVGLPPGRFRQATRSQPRSRNRPGGPGTVRTGARTRPVVSGCPSPRAAPPGAVGIGA